LELDQFYLYALLHVLTDFAIFWMWVVLYFLLDYGEAAVFAQLMFKQGRFC